MADREYYNQRAPNPPIRRRDYLVAAEAAGGRHWKNWMHTFIQLGPIVVREEYYDDPGWRRYRFADEAQAIAWASGESYPDPVEVTSHKTAWEALGLPQPPDADPRGL